MQANRREVLKWISVATGFALIGQDRLGNFADARTTGSFLSPSEIALVDEVGEAIIPTTDTPGAKAAQIGHFMSVMVKDCYSKEEQLAFKAGLSKLKSFLSLSNDKREALLVALEKEAKAYNDAKPPTLHYYTMIKQLTLFGYFTSEIGATVALRHVAIPGRYDGEYPYKKGDRAFSDDV